MTLGRAAAGDHGSPPPCLVLRWDGRAATASGPPHVVLGGEAVPGAQGPADRRPEGIFAEWCWDGRRLEARTDRLGFQPLFYAAARTAAGDTLWLSPSIPELLRQGAPAELDDAALAVFFRLAGFLGEDTAFRHVRAAPPGARITWEDGRLTVAGARALRPWCDVPRDRAVDRYVELFRAAVAKHDVDPERTLVPLTAGRDSRHILLELHAAGYRVPTLTVLPAPPKSAEDATLAAKLAAAAGVPHRILDVTADRLADEREKNWRTGLTVLEHFWAMQVVRAVDGRDLVVYDGIGGDTLSEAKYMSAERMACFRAREFRRYAEAELRPEAYLPAVLRPEAYRRFARGLALERLEAELRTHADAPNPVGSYRFWNRTRRAVAMAPFGMLSRVATVRAPFLDDDLYDFLASLPGEMLVDRTFHSTAIARAYPAFASVPYEDPKAPRRPAGAHVRRFGRRALWAALAPCARDGGERLVRRGAYAARLAALLALPGERGVNAGGLATLGTFVAQLEELTGPVRGASRPPDAA